MPSYCSNQSINKNYFLVSIYPQYNSPPPITSYNSFASYIDTTDFYYTLEGVSIPYHSSITIINKIFSSVYELSYIKHDESVDYFQRAYYNKSKGIVGFQTKNGIKWYLDN
jgi:hypothetical protein